MTCCKNNLRSCGSARLGSEEIWHGPFQGASYWYPVSICPTSLGHTGTAISRTVPTYEPGLAQVFSLLSLLLVSRSGPQSVESILGTVMIVPDFLEIKLNWTWTLNNAANLFFFLAAGLFCGERNFNPPWEWVDNKVYLLVNCSFKW